MVDFDWILGIWGQMEPNSSQAPIEPPDEFEEALYFLLIASPLFKLGMIEVFELRQLMLAILLELN